MAAFTNYLEDALLNHVLRGIAFSMPANIYVALFTVATTDSSFTGEVSTIGTAYTRIQIVGPSAFGAPASGQVSNGGDVTWATATSGWGTVTHVAIFDAISGGNALFHGPLATPKTINTGDTFRFLTGQLVVGLD